MKKISPYGIDILKTAMAFGLTLGLQLYIIGVLFGGFLDRRFGCTPLFQIVGILLALFLSFYRFISDVNKATQKEEKRGGQKPPEFIDYDAIFSQEKENPEEKNDDDKR